MQYGSCHTWEIKEEQSGDYTSNPRCQMCSRLIQPTTLCVASPMTTHSHLQDNMPGHTRWIHMTCTGNVWLWTSLSESPQRLLSKDSFDAVIKTAKAVSFEEEQAFTLAGKLENLLTHAVMNKIGLCFRADDHSSLQDANGFKALLT